MNKFGFPLLKWFTIFLVSIAVMLSFSQQLFALPSTKSTVMVSAERAKIEWFQDEYNGEPYWEFAEHEVLYEEYLTSTQNDFLLTSSPVINVYNQLGDYGL